MYVEERHQRQGLGKRLMQALIHLAGQIPGLEQIRLYVVDTNESARQLYRSMGFATYGLEIHAMKLNETTYVNEELMVYRMPKREETTTVEKSALLVIDVQEGMFDEAYPVYAGDGLLKQIQLLIAKARSSGAPVIYVQHNEGPGEPLATHTPAWKIHSAIAPAEDDVIVQKHTPDSFHRTNLQDELTKLGVRRLVLTGMQTEMCIDTTCRRAVSLGYDVVLAQDAHSTWSSEQLTAEQIIEHHNQVLRWFAKMENSADIAF
jgi:nicotinamidase-related amidase